MKIEDRLDCLASIINGLDIKTPISPNTLYDLQLHISMAQTEVEKLNIPFDGMKSWGLKEINFHTATMIINSTNLREHTHAPIFYTVCYAPFLFIFL